MQDIFIARQPIVDQKESLVAFELLFRSASNAAVSGVVDDTSATAQVMVNAFEELGIPDVLGAHRGFINLNAPLLHSDLIELLPKKQVMLELLETIAIDSSVVARCHELKSKGFSLALDDVVELSDAIKPLLHLVEVVKFDLPLIGPERLPALVKEFKRYPVKLLAEKVEDREQARHCKEMGFDLFQGYHFARPEMLAGKRADPSKLVLIQLLTLMMTDAGNDEIEEAFKGHADLTYNLLRMVNSVGFGLLTKIHSVKHGLIVLGREPLRRWVQLLLYASNKGQVKVNPLMQLAASRGKLLELAAHQERRGDQDYADRAFMVGMLSLLDALMNEPLATILARMNLDDEALAALLKRQGSLGDLLTLCEKVEIGDLDAIKKMLSNRPSMTVETLNRAQLEALKWANNIVM